MKRPVLYVVERRLKRKGAKWQALAGYVADTKGFALNQLSYAKQDEESWTGALPYDYHIARYVRVSPGPKGEKRIPSLQDLMDSCKRNLDAAEALERGDANA